MSLDLPSVPPARGSSTSASFVEIPSRREVKRARGALAHFNSGSGTSSSQGRVQRLGAANHVPCVKCVGPPALHFAIAVMSRARGDQYEKKNKMINQTQRSGLL